MRYLEGDGMTSAVVKYDHDSVYNNDTVAAAGGVLAATDPILNIPDQFPTLQLWWTASSTTIDISMRILDAPRGNVLETIALAAGIDTTAQAGFTWPMRDITAVPQIYGWCDILIENNDPANDLTGLYGVIFCQDK